MAWFKRTPKETPEQRAVWLEKAVHTAGTRAHGAMLAQLHHSKRRFEAAETPAFTDSWATHTSSINETLASQLPTLRARARGLARDNEWAVGYLIQQENQILGPQGIRLQMRLMQGNGKPATAQNDRVEAWWRQWGQRGNCEPSGKWSWRDIERMVLRAPETDGEILLRKRPGQGPMGFQVQVLDPALLDVAHTGDHQGRRIRMGVEITDDGRPVAYWLRAHKSGEAPTPYVTTGRHVRIPADEIIHHFDALEPGQLRGVPALAIGARRLWLLHDFEQAAAVASSNSAKREGFFVSPTGDAPPGFADTVLDSVLAAAQAEGKTLTPEEIERIKSAAEKFNTTMPGQFDTLPLGYDFRPFESDWPNVDGSAYIKQQVRGWATARGRSYVTVGNDLEAVNYSSARVGILDEREQFKATQAKLISWLHEAVFNDWLRYAVLQPESGLQPSRLEAYKAAATWQPRRWQGIDPVKEAAAHEINLQLGLTSRRRLILERGEDPDEIAAEIEAEREQFGALPHRYSGAATPEPPEPAPQDS